MTKTASHEREYVLVHVVAGESMANLIAPQVIDPMRTQAQVNGPRMPARTIALFLEPARVALAGRMRRRIAAFRRRAPELDVMLHAFVSRVSMARNARWLAWRLRRRIRDRQVVFHCRGEYAIEWAATLRQYFADAAIIADIRGAWPEEYLFARGYDGPEQADQDTRRGYDAQSQQLRTALARAGAVFSVSPGMLEWLEQQGADAARLTYVPCCVPAVTFNRTIRDRMRGDFELSTRTVLAYAGTLGRYQHIEDGVIPFFRAMAERHNDAHLLAIVSDAAQFRALLRKQNVPSDRATIVTVAQEHVAGYLCAADAGLLLRAPSRMNRFSQPTKLAEYLSAGLPVVVSRGTGRVDRLIEDSDAGFAVHAFAVPWPKLVDEADRVWRGIRSRGEALRQNALSLCEREFLWTSYTEQVRDAYTMALTTAKS